MAIYDVVLDPDGDILVIVSGTSLEDTWKYFVAPNPEPNGTTPDETADTPEEAVPEEAIGNEEPLPSAPAPPLPLEEDQRRFRASSKHLALASTYVKKMISGPWREANEVHEDGLLHWKLDGFDVDAIAIILRIIHGLNRQVQRTITLNMLAQVSRAVDYLGCHEAIELYASIWVAYLNGLPPRTSHVDWDSWISATGVFQNPDIFKKWTRVAILEKLNDSPSLELPLLSQAYGKPPLFFFFLFFFPCLTTSCTLPRRDRRAPPAPPRQDPLLRIQPRRPARQADDVQRRVRRHTARDPPPTAARQLAPLRAPDEAVREAQHQQRRQGRQGPLRPRVVFQDAPGRGAGPESLRFLGRAPEAVQDVVQEGQDEDEEEDGPQRRMGGVI